ncbi:Alpha/Beta hydrolase protein [Cladorrhinum sp. PSN259]|nr:Alpha/Beta hydrolase protein [Cladorrhinum sp. PSN259]
MSSSEEPSISFPPPIIIPPLNPSAHDQTFIILHGRGSSSQHFASPFITTSFPLSCSSSSPSTSSSTPGYSPSASPPTPTTTLQTLFSTAKFIFPSAHYSRATIYKRSLITQWFDSWHLDGDDSSLHPKSPSKKWRAISGLQTTTSYIHNLIREEAALLLGGTKKIILGGISQGCAASLVALMLWDGEERLGGYLGMCGWLPFAETIKKDVIDQKDNGKENDDEWDPFQRDSDEEEENEGEQPSLDIGAAAVRAMRESLELDSNRNKGPVSRPQAFDTPVFLGHGDQDPKVPVYHGKEAAEVLSAVGFTHVSWNDYLGLGHWYSPQMLRDIATFIQPQGSEE